MEEEEEVVLARLGIAGRRNTLIENGRGRVVGENVASCIVKDALKAETGLTVLKRVVRRCVEEEEEEEEEEKEGGGRSGDAKDDAYRDEEAWRRTNGGKFTSTSISSKRMTLVGPNGTPRTRDAQRKCTSARACLARIAVSARALPVKDSRGAALWLAYFEGLASALPRAIGYRAVHQELHAMLSGTNGYTPRVSRILLASEDVVRAMLRACRGAEIVAETAVAFFLNSHTCSSTSAIITLLTTIDAVDESHALMSERVTRRKATHALDSLNAYAFEKCLLLLSMLPERKERTSRTGDAKFAKAAMTTRANDSDSPKRRRTNVLLSSLSSSYGTNLKQIFAATRHRKAHNTHTRADAEASIELSAEATRFVIGVFTAMVPRDRASILKENISAVRIITPVVGADGTNTTSARQQQQQQQQQHNTNARIELDIIAKEYKILAHARLRDFSLDEKAAKAGVAADGNDMQHALVRHMKRQPSRSTLEDIENFRAEFAKHGLPTAGMLVNVITMWRREWWNEEAMPALAWPPSNRVEFSKTTAEHEKNVATHVAMVEALVARQLCSPLVLEKLRENLHAPSTNACPETTPAKGGLAAMQSLGHTCKTLLAEIGGGTQTGKGGGVAFVPPPASRVEMLVQEISSSIRTHCCGGPDGTDDDAVDDVIEMLMEAIATLVLHYAPLTKISHDKGAGSTALVWSHTLLSAVHMSTSLSTRLIDKLEAFFSRSTRTTASAEGRNARQILPQTISSLAALMVAMHTARVSTAHHQPLCVRTCFDWTRRTSDGGGNDALQARGVVDGACFFEDFLLPQSDARGIRDEYDLALVLETISRFLHIARTVYRGDDHVHIVESKVVRGVAPKGTGDINMNEYNDHNWYDYEGGDDGLVLKTTRSGGTAIIISAMLIRFVEWTRQRLEARLKLWNAFCVHFMPSSSHSMRRGTNTSTSKIVVDAEKGSPHGNDPCESVLYTCHRLCEAISSLPCAATALSNTNVDVVVQELVRFELAVARNAFMVSASATRTSIQKNLSKCAAARREGTDGSSSHAAVAHIATMAVTSIVHAAARIAPSSAHRSAHTEKDNIASPIFGPCVASFRQVNAMLGGVIAWTESCLPSGSVALWARDTCRAIDVALSVEGIDSASAIAAFLFAASVMDNLQEDVGKRSAHSAEITHIIATARSVDDSGGVDDARTLALLSELFPARNPPIRPKSDR